MYALNKNGDQADLLKENGEVSLSVVGETKRMRAKRPVALENQLDKAKRLTLPELFDLASEDLHDFLMQVLGKPELSRDLLQKLYRQAKERFAYENYQRYSRLWLLQLAVAAAQDHFKPVRRGVGQKPSSPLAYLTYQEVCALVLRDRLGLSKADAAAVLRITEGAVEQRTMHARERLAQHFERWSSPNPFSFSAKGNLSSLRTRIRIHQFLDGDQSSKVEGDEAKAYLAGIERARTFVRELPEHATPELEYSGAASKKQKRKKSSSGWESFPWHWKLALECAVFGLVGAVAVFVLPAFLSYYEDPAGQTRRLQASAPVLRPVQTTPVLEDGGRGPASVSSQRPEPVQDEFAYMDFPQGENHLEGSAPLAPSRKGGPIYRLIVQSENPKELAPRIRSLFVASNATERERSGSSMPGGVYFDAITTEEDYTRILSAISAMAPTKPYQNSGRRGHGAERARLIIWVQQI